MNKRKEMKKDNRRGWLRIVEAFIGVLIVMSVLLILMTRQDDTDQEGEILKIERHILDQVSQSEALREEVLRGDLSTVEILVEESLPEDYSYVVKTCNVGEICALNFYVDAEVYTEEVLITSTLETYSPMILKLFFWHGPFPEDVCQVNCTLDETQCYDDTHYRTCIQDPDKEDCNKWGEVAPCDEDEECEAGGCVPIVECVDASDCDDGFACTVDSCVAGSCSYDYSSCVGELDASYSLWDKNEGSRPPNSGSNNWWYYDITIKETSGLVGVELLSRQKCYKDMSKSCTISRSDIYPDNPNAWIDGCWCDPVKYDLDSWFDKTSLEAGETINSKTPQWIHWNKDGKTYKTVEYFDAKDNNNNELVNSYDITVTSN